MGSEAFHRWVWRTARPFAAAWLRHKFAFTPELYTGEGPYLVMCNHTTPWDPLLLACAFPKQMYFVASEHIFRWGPVSSIIRFLVSPISRLKGRTAGDTALAAIRRLRGGSNVAIFPAGDCSFAGTLSPLHPSTGKLVRASGVKLVTYRIEGGYFSAPRWSGGRVRRGRMTGTVAGEYEASELKKMSAGDITALIERDLCTDAYAAQRREMQPYRGSKPAEHLETVLFICPRCLGEGTLHSRGELFSCDKCGLELRYDEYCFLRGEDAPFDNITGWDNWQTAQLSSLLSRGDPIFMDGGMRLYEISPDHRARLLGEGELSLSRERLDCCGRSFPLSELGGFALHGAQIINFSCHGRSYEIKPRGIHCTRKYLTAIEMLAAESAAENGGA